ncbi:unnamed protein product, partial [Meganyctiphanes norvegica]
MALQQQVLVVEDFEAHYEDELTLNTGEHLTVTQQNVEDGWWEGFNHYGRTGRFPAMFVQVVNTLEDTNRNSESQTTSMRQVRVVVEFDGGDDGELKLVAGELLTVVQQGEEEGWLHGYNQTGNYGRFPAFFVEDVPGNQQYMDQNIEDVPVTLPNATISPSDNINAQANYDTQQNNLRATQLDTIHDFTNALENMQEFVASHFRAGEVSTSEEPNIQDEQINQPLSGAAGSSQAQDEHFNQPLIGATAGSQENTTNNQKKVVVLEDFMSNEGGELSIFKGETLTVIRTDIDWEDTWWEGVNIMGQMGRFPRIFVTEFEEKPLIQQQDYEPCEQIHSCGHKCCGVRGEQECLPCLFGCANDKSLNQASNDMCVICFTEPLMDKPTIQVTGNALKSEKYGEMHLKWPNITFQLIPKSIWRKSFGNKCLSKTFLHYKNCKHQITSLPYNQVIAKHVFFELEPFMTAVTTRTWRRKDQHRNQWYGLISVLCGRKIMWRLKCFGLYKCCKCLEFSLTTILGESFCVDTQPQSTRSYPRDSGSSVPPRPPRDGGCCKNTSSIFLCRITKLIGGFLHKGNSCCNSCCVDFKSYTDDVYPLKRLP